MVQGYMSLTEKEKETLRLLLAGHDAKSMARLLGLSVHTINERLRDARRKLGVSSSKEAARLLREAESADPESIGDKPIGAAAAAPADQEGGEPSAAAATTRTAWAIGGFAMLSFALAMLALSGAAETAQDRTASAATATAETPGSQAARQWLALVDAARWQESWAATAASFQSLNSVEAWRSASQSARVPLGRALSRDLLGQQMTPTPPSGHLLVRFRTRFANQADAVETISLAREGEGWRVAGYVID
jgi:DNA-binding CsgD family transcriptional regulator